MQTLIAKFIAKPKRRPAASAELDFSWKYFQAGGV
jgi:hypothetical protein